MSDDKTGNDGSDAEEPDGFDWLARQFDPTEQVPTQAPAAPPSQAPRQDVPPRQPSPAPVQPPAASPAPAAPPAAPAAAPQGGGFQWGLRPGGGATPPPLVPPAVAPPAIVPPVSEPDPGPPTQAMTQPLSWRDLPDAPTLPSPAVPTDTPVPPLAASQPVSSFDQPTWATTPTPDPAPASAEARDPTSAIDKLFGENQFQEYEDVGVLQGIAAPAESAAATTGYAQPAAPARPTAVERTPLSRGQWTTIIVIGSVLAVAALVALFFLGHKLGAASAQRAATPSGSSSTVPTQAPSSGLASPGVHPFTALMGGECVTPFTSAWAATYTVVDCSAEHTGQLIFKGTLPDAAGTAYPNGAAFKTEITPLCSAPTALDYSAAKAITDLQVSFSYPATAQAWAGGDRTYYCFVNRDGGGTFKGSLAGTQK